MVDGFRFASQAEARRYKELLLLGQAGQVRNLELQPRFDLHVGGVKTATYIADFRYEERAWTPDVIWSVATGMARCRRGREGHEDARLPAEEEALRGGVRQGDPGNAMTPDDLTPTEREEFEERASIVEYDGNLPRAEAERLARQWVIEARQLPWSR